MNRLIVVLALSGLCAAVPEADPALIVPGPYAALPLAYNNLALPYAAPYGYATAVPVVRATKVLTPKDCVTPQGCAVRSLIDSGLVPRVRREAEAEAEADPATILASPYAGTLLGNGLPYLGQALPYGLPYGLPYARAYGYASPLLQGIEVPQVKAIEVPEVVEVAPAPAPVAPVVRAVEAPLLRALRPVVRAATVVRPATPVTVVEKRTKPVTYTHLGAHPINPTTVLETETQISQRLI